MVKTMLNQELGLSSKVEIFQPNAQLQVRLWANLLGVLAEIPT